MRLHNTIAQTQAQPCFLSGWLSREERLKDFVFDRVGDAGPVVSSQNLYFVSWVFGGYGDLGFIIFPKFGTLEKVVLLSAGVKSIAV